METNKTISKLLDNTSPYNILMEDANWMMTAAFIIFTMQTGN
jgi:hypothetical protein